MARRRTPDEVKRFDLAKYTILITLILLFIILFIIRSIQKRQLSAQPQFPPTPLSPILKRRQSCRRHQAQ